MSCARLVIAGVSSGVGKTTVTCALALALRRRGLSVVTFKCGPDYLDPTYHARASGSPSHNLDGWMMGREAVLQTFARVCAGHDVALIEGVMGLYDGADPSSDLGSTAQVANWLKAPVLLVVDAGGMARSFAALVAGFVGFDGAPHIPGVLANRVGSRSHLELLRRALPSELALFGLPKQHELRFPERHLGLRTADAAVPDESFEAWAELAASWLDLDGLLALAGRTPLASAGRAPASVASKVRIGVAHDEAFHFYYQHNLLALEAEGAELVRFSPCRDGLPERLDGLYLGGGYPELHARALAENRAMREAIASFAARGGPIYAECGGLMYLTRAIETLDGEQLPMVGLLPRTARMASRLQALGYAEVTTTRETVLGPAGVELRGHQFRYSDLHGDEPLTTAYKLRVRRSGSELAEGYVQHNVLASYVHAHWGATPAVPRAFVHSCQRFAASLPRPR